jgi:hypothetical protein
LWELWMLLNRFDSIVDFVMTNDLRRQRGEDWYG